MEKRTSRIPTVQESRRALNQELATTSDPRERINLIRTLKSVAKARVRQTRRNNQMRVLGLGLKRKGLTIRVKPGMGKVLLTISTPRIQVILERFPNKKDQSLTAISQGLGTLTPLEVRRTANSLRMEE
jgi:hypothetical protein